MVRFIFPSFFEPFITDGQLDESASQYFQPDGIHPNATGVKMVVESVGPIVYGNDRAGGPKLSRT